MALGKQIGEFKVHHTSVGVDAVGSELSYTKKMGGKASRLPGEGTLAWTQVALAIGLAVLLSLCDLACSSGSSPEQPQARQRTPLPSRRHPEGQRRPLPNRLRQGMRISLRSSKRRGKAIWMKWSSDASSACWCRSGGRSSSTWKGRPAGILQEAFQELEKVLNTKYKTTAANRIIVGLLPTPMDRLRERMAGGYGDIAAASISITEANKAIADFTIPTVTGLKIIVVTGPGAPELKSVEDLSGKEVWVMPQTRMKKDLEDLNARLKSQGKAPAMVREADPVLEPGDVMEMVNAGVYPVALMQSLQAEFWAQVFDNIKPRKDLALAEDVQLGWAIQKGTPQLKAFLDDFIKTHGVGTSFGNTVMRRYLKEAKYVRNATEVNEMKKFQATLPHFKKYSQKYNLDYLMMAAQGYQESRLDQSVKSQVGAVGIMQVLPSTAASAPVKIPNIETEENNIHAGARLMHFLIEDHFNEPGLDLQEPHVICHGFLQCRSGEDRPLSDSGQGYGLRSEQMVQQRRGCSGKGDRPGNDPVCGEYLQVLCRLPFGRWYVSEKAGSREESRQTMSDAN